MKRFFRFWFLIHFFSLLMFLTGAIVWAFDANVLPIFGDKWGQIGLITGRRCALRWDTFDVPPIGKDPAVRYYSRQNGKPDSSRQSAKSFSGVGWYLVPVFDENQPNRQVGMIRFFFCPGWLPAMLLLFISGNSLRKTLAQLRNAEIAEPKTPRCSKCGYDLRATPLRCPECGQANT